MKRKIAWLIVGLVVSLLVITELHSYLFVDWCLDAGGSVDPQSQACLMSNGELNSMVFTNSMGLVYVLIGIVIMAATVLMGEHLFKLFGKTKT